MVLCHDICLTLANNLGTLPTYSVSTDYFDASSCQQLTAMGSQVLHPLVAYSDLYLKPINTCMPLTYVIQSS